MRSHDVLILLPNDCDPEADPALKSSLERFISQCWDQGLEIGSSVRNVDDCIREAEGDITVQTSLLESRWIAGGVRCTATHINEPNAARSPVTAE